MYFVEIWNTWAEESRLPLLVILANLSFALFDLYRNDEVLCDRELNMWSLKRENQETPTNKTDLMLYSDRLCKQFPDYELDHKLTLRPKADTPTMSFDIIKDLLLSKDLSRNKELEYASSE